MSRRDQDAVQAYLNELLAEVGDAPALAAEVTFQEPDLQDQLHALEQIKRQQLQALLDRQVPVPAPVLEVVAPVPAPAEEVVPAPTNPLLQWCENGRPVWAQTRFEVLLFQVAGLTLAVPLIALGQIYPLGDSTSGSRLSRVFGQADWFMGLLPTPAGQIRTVNTALFVMPERYDPAFEQQVRYVITIDGLDWGLAVDKVQQPTRLLPDEVTWRTDRSKRPWLAGTVKSAMCALLDIPQMGRLLEEHDRKRRLSTPPE